MSFFDDTVSSVNSGSNMIVCGDFNIDLLRMNEDRTSASFYDSMHALSLIPTISKPTRIADTSCTLIDNIFARNLGNFKSGILTMELSDHLPIYIIYNNIFAIQPLCPEKITYRIINESSLNNLYQSFNMDNLEEILVENNINKSIELLHNKILKNYNIHCPIKTKYISPKDKIKPWINSNIKNKIKHKQKLFMLTKQNSIPHHIYYQYRNKVNSEVKRAKKLYYKEAFVRVVGNSKKTWTIVNNILQSSKKKGQELY